MPAPSGASPAPEAHVPCARLHPLPSNLCTICTSLHAAAAGPACAAPAKAHSRLDPAALLPGAPSRGAHQSHHAALSQQESPAPRYAPPPVIPVATMVRGAAWNERRPHPLLSSPSQRGSAPCHHSWPPAGASLCVRAISKDTMKSWPPTWGGGHEVICAWQGGTRHAVPCGALGELYAL